MRYEPGQVIDHYEVIEQLGAGAYSQTYKARDIDNDQIVVLKSPEPMLFADPSLHQRYQREMEIVRRLHHPGVQGAVDVGASRTEPYLVLEYVDGQNLRQRFRAMDHKPPVDVALDWGRQLAEALAYLHNEGVVHRDLKPENVLVTADDRLKIADFGTALLAGARRLTWRHLTESLGTPDYMSPEQVQGDRGDARSDVYAWGVMMYELLTGRVPFAGDNWMAVMAGHMQGNPVRIRKLRPEVPAALEAVVLKAMRRYPENRYESAKALLADLDHLDALDPKAFDLSPEPPMGGMASAETAQRLWFLVAMIALGFIAVVTIIILLTVALR